MPTAMEVKALFRAFLRGGRSFPNYGIKEYVLRRSKEEFRSGASAAPARAQQLWEAGKEQLEVLKRQSLVYGLYGRKVKNVLELELSEHPAVR